LRERFLIRVAGLLSHRGKEVGALLTGVIETCGESLAQQLGLRIGQLCSTRDLRCQLATSTSLWFGSELDTIAATLAAVLAEEHTSAKGDPEPNGCTYAYRPVLLVSELFRDAHVLSQGLAVGDSRLVALGLRCRFAQTRADCLQGLLDRAVLLDRPRFDKWRPAV